VLTLKTIDAHVAGAPLRLVIDGFPTPRGKTMAEKRAWATRHADGLRRALMLEPRGHTDMCGAVLTEPVSAGAHAGVLFMDNEGYTVMSGHGVIAVAAMALARGLIVPGGDGQTLVFDTVAGTVRAMVAPQDVLRARFVNVPSFVLHGGVDVKLGARIVRVDIAFGGAFYAIVDGEAAGIPLDPAHLPELRRTGMTIAEAVSATFAVAHPEIPAIAGIQGTIFTGPPQTSSSDLRCVTVFADAAVDRSPSGTGLSAVLTVLDAMGLVMEDSVFTAEGLIGTTLRAQVIGRTTVGDYAAIIPEVEGRAWIIGEHAFTLDPDDPLREGIRVW
jgi:trans-L-3-hydroxyproline dehydratase